MADPTLLLSRPVFLTREASVFRLAFNFDPKLVERVKTLPYAHFDGETRSWTAMVCTQSVDILRAMFTEGLVDVYVDTLLAPGEELQRCKEATLRSGTVRRPFVVATAGRNDALYARLTSIPGGQWDKQAGGISFGPQASTALAELAARGILDDPDKLLTPADIVVAFDGRTGRFAVRGDARAQVAFDAHFPNKDVVALWKSRDIDVAFADTLSEEIYRGELARISDGLQPEGLKFPLFDYQAQNVAVAVERSGLGVWDAPGLGKCLSAQTKVWVNGSRRAIGELWDSYAGPAAFDGEGEWALPTDRLLVHASDETGKAVTVPVGKLYRQRVKETLSKVTLDDGSSVTITAAHKLLTTRGWSNQYQAGDRVAVPRRIEWAGETVDPDVVKFLAWQIAEGNETDGQLRISQNDRAVLEDLEATWYRLAERYGFQAGVPNYSSKTNPASGKPCYSLRLRRTGWKALLESKGYDYGQLSAGKSIPDFVMQGGQSTARLFLREYMAAEGSVSVANGVVEYSSASEELAEQIVVLLRRFGIWVRRTVKMKAATNGTGIQRPYHFGFVTGKALTAFCEEVGFAHTGKQALLEQAAEKAKGRSNLDTLDVVHLLAEARELVPLPPSHYGIAWSALTPRRHLNHATATKAAERLRMLANGTAESEYRSDSRTWAAGNNKWRQRCLDAYDSIDTSTSSRLFEIADEIEVAVGSDLAWATIERVEPVHVDDYVYDLEVPVHHNFVAGGILCHNTATGIGTGVELMVNRREVPRVVVVVPGAVRTQWAREIARFTGLPTDSKGMPTVDVVIVDGDKKKRHRAYEAAKDAKWMIVNYDVLHLDYKLISPLVAGSLLILDEAHRIKSPTSKRTKAARQLAARAARRLALSGTPVENEPGEWFSLISGFVMPGALGSATDFLGRYQYPNRWGGYEGARNLGELRDRSKVYFVRHTKDQVAKHLPPLRVQHLQLDVDPQLSAALKRAHKEARDEIKQASLERVNKSAHRPISEEEWEEVETGAEMTAVGMLRLMCSSPRLLALSESAAARALVESGLVPEEDGPKLDDLRVRAAEMQATNERLVVFTFSKRMAKLISERFEEDGIRHVLFTGETSTEDRDAAVRAFTTPGTEDDPGPTVFVATDAAAEGLNLGRCCSTLVNFDIPWTPGRIEQRSNRIHRIDGTSPHYLVINLTLTGTIEHGILRMVETKADLQDAIFGERGGRKKTTGRGGRSIFEEAMASWEKDSV